MREVNFAVVGCGKIGSRHAAKLQEVSGAKLVAVCDIVPEKAQVLAEKYGCAAYFDIAELLKDPKIEFVNICTPSGLHAEHSLTALRAGKNVLCEKPMALTEKDAQTMMDTARELDKMLFVMKQNRYNPPVRLVSRLIREGKMGKPVQCVVNMLWNRGPEYYKSDPWRGTLKLDGGTIYTQASHFVDLMLMFMGKAKDISAFMGTYNHDIEIEDTGTINVKFANGALGTMNYTTCATKKNVEGSVTLVFTEGTVKIGGEYLNTVDYFQVNGVDSYELDGSDTQANDYGSYKGSMSNHHKVFADIVNIVNERPADEQLVSGDEAIETIRFIEAAIKSAKTGEIIHLN